MMQTGYGYLFDPSHGLWHNAAGGQKYAELFRTEGIIQKLIAEEVRAYMNAGSMKEIRGIIKEYCEFFKLLERHLPIYSNSIEELESDIPRWKASLVSDSKELRGMALTNLKRTGGEDIAVNAENYEYFLQVIYVLTAYVSFVRSGMHRDSVGTKTFAVKSGLDNVRIVTSAGITQSGYLIDIYT